MTPSLSANVIIDDLDDSDQPATSASILATATIFNDSTSLSDDTITVWLTYNSISLRNSPIFHTVLGIMRLAVSDGDSSPTRRFEGLRQAQGFELNFEHDGYGDPLLRYQQVYGLVRTMVR